MLSPAFQKTIEAFRKLPGIGPRQATRCIFYLLKTTPEEFDNFTASLREVREGSLQCQNCFRIFETENRENGAQNCNICMNPRRTKEIIMVVENDQDLISIESLHTFDGVYVVLGTKEETMPAEEKISRVLKTVVREKRREIILATNPTLEGNSLAHKIKTGLRDPEIKITRLGRGLPTGAEIEYADQDPLNEALESRR